MSAGFNELYDNLWNSISAHIWVYVPMAKAVAKELKKELQAYYKETKENNSFNFLRVYRHKIFETVKKLFKKYPTEDPFQWNEYVVFEQFYNMVRGRFCMQNEYPIELFNYCISKWGPELEKYYNSTTKPTYNGAMGIKIRGKTLKELLEKKCKESFTKSNSMWPFKPLKSNS